jgi:hypothetical protein
VVTKITIIVAGLISVVPHGAGDGVTVLLRDAFLSRPTVEMPDGQTTCSVGIHVPVVVQKEGTCEGDCAPFNLSAANEPLARVLGGWVAPATSTGSPLFWIPAQQSMEFGALVGSPGGQHDLSYGFRLGSGSARVDADCLGDAASCPIVGRFRVPHGAIKTCRLSTHTTTGYPALFATTPVGAGPPGIVTEPLGETWMLEIETSQSLPFELHATNFTGDRIMKTARLLPSADGNLVLFIANLPMDHKTGGSHSADCASTSPNPPTYDMGQVHSAALYDLSSGIWGPPARLVADYVTSATNSISLDASCAEYSALSAGSSWAGILDALEYPSNPAKCRPLAFMQE